jgi:hypothetical protein
MAPDCPGRKVNYKSKKKKESKAIPVAGRGGL